MRWRYWQGNGLAIHKSQVRVPAGQCTIALGKLFTLVCLCYQTVQFGTGQGGDLFGWESNRGPGGK